MSYDLDLLILQKNVKKVIFWHENVNQDLEIDLSSCKKKNEIAQFKTTEASYRFNQNKPSGT